MRGRLEIYTPRTSKGESWVEIHVEDEKSGIQFLTVCVDYHEFARALTGHGSQECSFGFNDLHNVGKRREIKEVVVKVPEHDYLDRDVVAAAAVNEHEIDGWMGRVKDAQNHHRHAGGRAYRVTYIRFVDED